MTRPKASTWGNVAPSFAARDKPLEEYVAEVRAIKQAERAIEQRRCPNDGKALKRNGCTTCGFALIVAPPRHSTPDAGFNRRPTPAKRF
jgi:hypothetical protein